MRFFTAVFLACQLALAVTAARADTLVILVRHAEKTTDKNDPGLTASGEARATALAEALQDTRIDRIIVSEFQRTTLTAAPVANARGLDPLVVGAGLALDDHILAVAEVVAAGTGNILVVGHSNTIPRIIAALGGPVLPEMDDLEYATMFILSIPTQGEASLVKARFGAPDASND